MLTRKQAADAAGCHAETIRYYERINLMPEPMRSESGYRLYDEAGIRRLRFIVRARSLGFSTDEVGQLLDAAGKRGKAATSLQDMIKDHLREIEAEILSLEEIAASLRAMAKADPDDQAAEDRIMDILMDEKPLPG